MNCGTCLHFREFGDGRYGACRRRAPVIAFSTCWESRWPTISASERGCGEWASRQEGECWAVVETTGERLAGRISADSSTGSSLTRVDVPEVEHVRTITDWIRNPDQFRTFRESYKIPAFSRLLGTSAICAISECDEDDARRIAASIGAKPCEGWEPEPGAMRREEVRPEDEMPF